MSRFLVRKELHMKTRFTLLWITGGLGTAALLVGLVLGVTSYLARNAGRNGGPAIAKVEAPRGGNVGFDVAGGFPGAPEIAVVPGDEVFPLELGFEDGFIPEGIRPGAAGERRAL